MSVADAAATGDRRATLLAMRDSLATAMDSAEFSVLAQIAGRLSAVLAELDAMPTEEVSLSDQLAQRRADRRSAAKVASQAVGGGV
jgi:hypothetical protein